MIAASQDVEGIRVAAREIFEHSLDKSRIERQLSRLDPDDPQRDKLVPVHKLSDGYYDYVAYLLWLKKQMNAGIELAERISADEAEGLSAVSAAYHEFEEDHPYCPCCGQRGYRNMRRCPSCLKELS